MKRLLSRYVCRTGKEVIPVIDLSSMPEDTLADIEAKRKKYREFLNSAQRQQLRLKADVYTAAFFAPKTPEYRDQIPTSEDILRLRGKLMPRPGVADLARTIAERNRFFHWRIEFPDVFEKGGFDCVLGNPPWERIKLQRKSFLHPEVLLSLMRLIKLPGKNLLTD
jgi:hypothetical protein